MKEIFQSKEGERLAMGKPVSLVYQDYVEPIMLEWVKMKPRPSYDELNKMLTVPWTIWNAVVLEDFYPEANDEGFMSQIHTLLGKGPVKGLVDWWIERKRRDFGKYRYMFGECLFYETKDGESRCRAEIKLPKNVTKKYGQYGEKSPYIENYSSLDS